MKKYFNLGLPATLSEDLGQICQSRGQSKTSFITQTIRARVNGIQEGRKYCAGGEPCILNFMPDPRNFSHNRQP